jgi:formylglycine-generating enzyme required for sulfatase activity
MNMTRWKSRAAPILLGLIFCAFVGSAKSGASLSAANTVPELKATETIDLGEGVTMEFVLIRPGSFLMGSSRNSYDETPVHKVAITKPYYIGKYEITQEQWEKVMGSNPSLFKGIKLPVENVSWEDCQLFLAALRKKIGRRFALPSEAQWEYACRAGTTTTYSFGDDEARLDEYAWFASNSDLKTHPVGQKKPNPWGLYDIHGNVFEWCADWYSESYPDGDATNPVGVVTGDRRTIRGGAWLYVADNLRSSDRGFSPADYRVNEYGLRCVMLVDGDEQDDMKQTIAPATTNAQPGERNPVALIAQLDAAIADANKYYAENLLTELEKLAPAEPRLASLRGKVAALPAPEANLVIDLAEGVTMEFVLIRPGSFTMGSDQSSLLNEKPAHRVTITKPYYIGKYEVTQKQWEALMSRNLSAFKSNPQRPDASALPVENVSWLLCQDFCAKLNEKLRGYELRLPTEAEWEYACRAGTTGEYNFGDGASLVDYAWFGSNSEGQTHSVGGKKPNAWGIYDMYGNVWEWCQDQYGPYSDKAEANPVSPSNSSSGTRVLRGGAWNNTPNHVNSTFRHDAGPDMLMRYYGFRCVAVVAPVRKK